jgi:hypothetical protein
VNPVARRSGICPAQNQREIIAACSGRRFSLLFFLARVLLLGKWKAFREDEKDKIKKIKALLNVEESNLMSTNRIEAYPAVWNTTSR